MKIIIQQSTKPGINLISPAKDDSEKSGIGLYPDRAFFEGKIDIEKLTEEVFDQLESDIHISADHLKKYFNLMATSINSATEGEAIGELNRRLDILELANRTEDSEAREEIFKLIHSGKTSPLTLLAFDNGMFPINTLAEIATQEIKHRHKTIWEETAETAEKEEKEKKQSAEEAEDCFFKTLKEKIKDKSIELKSYHKYFCVVQADGDNMGRVIAKLQEGKLGELSKSLIGFGKKASKKVKEFGGLPIYAGGDDLLFIAPVVSGESTIFNLIDSIDEEYKKVEKSAKELQGQEKEKEKQITSMSYGISINYYKYPLYEVLADARNLLFTDAKAERNSIACNLRKHSGASFKLLLNKTNSDCKEAFTKLMAVAQEDNLVSAVAHKLRDTSVLWKDIRADDKRLEAFFKKFMGLDEKNEAQKKYLKTVKDLVSKIPTNEKSEKTELEQSLYAMLRIAKFINGEEAKDE